MRLLSVDDSGLPRGMRPLLMSERMLLSEPCTLPWLESCG
jgi:hypothetical protein